MSKRDYYDILGLAKNASDDEIKKSYRKMAMQYHPDRNSDKGAEEKFKEAKEAYEFLSDADKRKQYDQFGHSTPFAHGNTHRGAQSWDFSKGADSDFSELFKHIFTAGSAGEDIFGNYKPRQTINIITITLVDAYKGMIARIDQQSTINIPKGVRSGTKFHINNKFYRVDIQPHNRFKRSNDDLLIDIEITAVEAMLGLESILEHLDCVKLQFNIPAGIQNGQIIRLSGKGMKNPETDILGDLLVRISINIPKVLTEQDRAALKTLNHRDIINI